MPSDTFYDENSHSLKKVNVVTRDTLGMLAVQILASKLDMATTDYDTLIRELHETIADLHESYHRLAL